MRLALAADAAALRSAAAEEADKLRAAAAATQQETFLKAATLIIETLKSLAVDLQPVLDQHVRRGVAALPRRRPRRLHPPAPPAPGAERAGLIKEKFEADPAFREHVLRYINQFETLLAQAKECDPAGSARRRLRHGRCRQALSRALERGRPGQALKKTGRIRDRDRLTPDADP